MSPAAHSSRSELLLTIFPPLPAALATTFDLVGRASVSACDPWWLIGSAAMALPGAAVEVGDVDLLTSPAVAESFCKALDGVAIARHLGAVSLAGFR